MTAAQRKAFVGAGATVLLAGVVISCIAWDRLVNQPMQAVTTSGWKASGAGNDDEEIVVINAYIKSAWSKGTRHH